MRVKIQMRGSYVVLFDVDTNHDVYMMRFTFDIIDRAQRYCAKRGWTLLNVRDGKVQL